MTREHPLGQLPSQGARRVVRPAEMPSLRSDARLEELPELLRVARHGIHDRPAAGQVPQREVIGEVETDRTSLFRRSAGDHLNARVHHPLDGTHAATVSPCASTGPSSSPT